MKKISLAVLVSLSAITGAAFAQADQGVSMSTDPGKISDIEQRAQALQSNQANMQEMPAHKTGEHHKKSGSKHSKKAAHAASASQ